MSKIPWRSEHTSVEKGGDEVWIAEKFQSNPEIAGSPRNSFRASLEEEHAGGRALNDRGCITHTNVYQTPNAVQMFPWSQTARDKLGSQKGKSPDLQLRSHSAC